MLQTVFKRSLNKRFLHKAPVTVQGQLIFLAQRIHCQAGQAPPWAAHFLFTRPQNSLKEMGLCNIFITKMVFNGELGSLCLL